MRNTFLILTVAVLLGSCTINKNLMFKTHTDYVFDTLSDSSGVEYQISPNDILEFRLFTNDGSRLLETTTGTSSQQRVLLSNSVFYTVERNGTVELPEIGRVHIAGMTTFEVQDLLEDKYSTLYNVPYAMVKVNNKRVMVFPGSGARATVIYLKNKNTTLIEAIALAGGIDDRGDASKIKLIRKNEDKYEIIKIDLSTIDGIEDANTFVQANDIVYVEPVPEIGREVFKDVSPFVSLVSGLALIYAIIKGAI